MRVVMLSWEYPPRIVGGISPHVQDLSHELVRQGLEVHVVTKCTPQAPDEEIDTGGVHVHRVHLEDTPNDFLHEIQLLNQATDKRVRRLLEDWRPGGQPTVFHAHDWLSLDSARSLKYEYKLPMVATIHATEYGRHGGIYNETSKYIHEQEYWLTYEAWRVIVCTQFMKNEVERYFNVPSDKIDIVFNGVKKDKFEFDWTEADRAASRLPYAKPEEKVVLFVGRFVREKGIQVLMSAASTVLALLPNTKFVVVGGGSRERFEGFVHWAGLGDRVQFTGFMANRALHQMYRMADVAVFPSLYEPFGIVALEAMAAGCAVVASDAGGLPEVVLHDQTGTLSYKGDSESLAWAILRVLEDPYRSERLKAAARVRLGTDFGWPHLASQTRDIYDRVWAEFLDSYWAAGTVWPVTPGAEDRARELELERKAEFGSEVPLVVLPPNATPSPSVRSDEEDDEAFWSPAF